MIDINIPARTISLRVPEAELAKRRAEQDAAGWKPVKPRARKALINVTTTRAPLAPTGWPRAIAPPLTFSFSSGSS